MRPHGSGRELPPRRLAGDLLSLFAAFVPALGGGVYKAFIRPRPFWAFFYDPETFYFHDGLRLLSGRAPLDFTNPGTPVQLLSALVALVTGQSPTAFDRFRIAAYCLAWALQLIAGFALLRTVLNGLSAPGRIAALATYFVCAQSLQYQTVWSPELLYFPVGTLAIVALGHALARDFDTRAALAAGGAVGLACAVKLVFLPWLGALLVTVLTGGAPRGRRLRATAVIAGGAAMAFVAATASAAARYPDMARWMIRLLTRSGAYGESPELLGDPALLATNAGTLLAAAKGWYAWLALAAIGAVAAIAEARGTPEARRLRGLAVFAATALVCGLAMVVRSPALRYLLPTAFCGVLLVAVAARSRLVSRHPALSWAALALVALMAGKHFQLDLRTHRSRIAQEARSRAELESAIARRRGPGSDPVVVYGYRAPMPSFALRYFATDRQLLDAVERLYPGEGHVGPGDRVFLPRGASRWDVFVLAADTRARLGAVARGQVVERVGALEVIVPAPPPAAAGGAAP